MLDLTLTALVAAAWCALHSLLIAPGIEAWQKQRLGGRAAWSRLAYNLLAAVTLLAVLLFFHRHPAIPLWRWHGLWQLPRAALLTAALWLGWLGARSHDNAVFLGLRQIRDASAGRTPPPPRFSRDGVLGLVRHPWYSAGILLLLAIRDFTTTNVVWRAVFVLYLLLGAWLEERKLLQVFGDDYAAYRREVPAFLPRPRRRHLRRRPR
jgi:protein-S-isoprenylcysteine O-methyltransferase Ste14